MDVDLKLPQKSWRNQWRNFRAYLFPDYMAKKVEKRRLCRCHIVESWPHQVSSLVNLIITSQELAYTWNELAMLKTLIEISRWRLWKVKYQTTTQARTDVFDTAQIYYGLYLCIVKMLEFDYYSPVIITNSNYLKDNKRSSELSKPSKKGYQYVWNIQKEAAWIFLSRMPLVKNVGLFHRISKIYCQKNTQATRKNGDNLINNKLECLLNGTRKWYQKTWQTKAMWDFLNNDRNWVEQAMLTRRR